MIYITYHTLAERRKKKKKTSITIQHCYSDSHLEQVQERAIHNCLGLRHVVYTTLQGRLTSFKDRWPKGKLPSPEQLSTAGW
jgi:hypothetical protein